MVAAIRSHQRLLPVKQKDPHIISLCDEVLTHGREVTDEARMALTWAAIQQRIALPAARQNPKRRVHRLMLAMVLLLLLIAGLCFATGLIPWITQLLWDHEQLTVDINQGAQHVNVNKDQPASDALVQMLLEVGIQIATPETLPDGYELVSVDVQWITDTWVMVIGRYESLDHTLYIQVDSVERESILHMVEKDAEPILTYADEGVSIAIFENLGYVSASYYAIPDFVTIAGDGVTLDEMLSMIQSTFGRVFTYEEYVTESNCPDTPDLPDG